MDKNQIPILVQHIRRLVYNFKSFSTNNSKQISKIYYSTLLGGKIQNYTQIICHVNATLVAKGYINVKGGYIKKEFTTAYQIQKNILNINY